MATFQFSNYNFSNPKENQPAYIYKLHVHIMLVTKYWSSIFHTYVIRALKNNVFS